MQTLLGSAVPPETPVTCSENRCHEGSSRPREGGPGHKCWNPAAGWHLTLTYQLCNQDNLTNPSVPQFPPL